MKEYIECLHQDQHMQGFTSDKDHKYMFWSFTNSIVKTSIEGTMICQARVSGGHFGGMDWHDGKIYISYMGYPEPWTFFGDWSSFKVYVYDDSDLRLIKIIDIEECIDMKNNEDGFQGIDGIAFGKVPGETEEKLLVAVALNTGEKYSNQMFLQVDEDGRIEKTYKVPAGNKVFGIQNLDFEADTGCFWFTTYNAGEPYMEPHTLYCVDPDMHTVRARYRILTPYGFEALGNGEYYLSLEGGVNGNRHGIAYKVTADELKALDGNLDALTINENVRAALGITYPMKIR